MAVLSKGLNAFWGTDVRSKLDLNKAKAPSLMCGGLIMHEPGGASGSGILEGKIDILGCKPSSSSTTI
jgi:hypothetical protein